jgi:xanthine dehydrogenase accessory factor
VSQTLSERIDQLSRSRVPFVRATVVRAQEPSSAHAGDRAIVLADGSMEGFVGGQCAAGSVRTAALDALSSGDSVLLRVLPESEQGFPETPGASVVVNPCLSGGALEIYLEPLLPPPTLHVSGSSPTAESLAELAPVLGFTVERAAEGADPGGAVAAVVSTHGGDEVPAIRRALDAGVGFVGLVSSRTRGKAVLAELDLDDAELARVHPHVGIDIGARTAPEIALSILAAVVRAIRVDGLAAAPAEDAAAAVPAPVQAVDPVCGMTVTVAPDTPHLRHEGADVWFCNPGCRDTFAASLAS